MGNTIFVDDKPVPKEQRWGRDVELDWSPDGEKKLREKIKANSARRNIILLMFGHTSAGKSSFCNGIKSAIEGAEEVTDYFSVGVYKGAGVTKGVGAKSYTKNFAVATHDYFSTVDMCGIYETEDIKAEDIKKIINGEVPFNAELTETLAVKHIPESVVMSGRTRPTCVVLVHKAGATFSHEITKQMRVVLAERAHGGTSVHLVLTQIDKLNKHLSDPEKLPRVFKSDKVHKAVMHASLETGIPPTSISVVKNFTEYKNTHPNMNILILHALDNILKSARAGLEREEQKRKVDAMYNVPESEDQQ